MHALPAHRARRRLATRTMRVVSGSWGILIWPCVSVQTFSEDCDWQQWMKRGSTRRMRAPPSAAVSRMRRQLAAKPSSTGNHTHINPPPQSRIIPPSPSRSNGSRYEAVGTYVYQSVGSSHSGEYSASSEARLHVSYMSYIPRLSLKSSELKQ